MEYWRFWPGHTPPRAFEKQELSSVALQPESCPKFTTLWICLPNLTYTEVSRGSDVACPLLNSSTFCFLLKPPSRCWAPYFRECYHQIPGCHSHVIGIRVFLYCQATILCFHWSLQNSIPTTILAPLHCPVTDWTFRNTRNSFSPRDLQWLLFEFKIKSTILFIAYKASQNLALRIGPLSPLPLSQCVPCVSYVKYSPASQVCRPVLFASRLFYKLLSFCRKFSSFKSQPRCHALWETFPDSVLTVLRTSLSLSFFRLSEGQGAWSP